MKAAHFEKKGTLNLFRRIGIRGSTLELVIGEASSGETHIACRHQSNTAALKAATQWMQWAREVGYAEIDLPEGIPGVVFRVDGQKGPGRIRIDTAENVYFDIDSVAAPRLKMNQRVVVQDIHRRRGPPIDFMFGSKLEAGRVIAFPEPKWSHVERKADLSQKVRDGLMRSSGEALSGHRSRDTAFDNARCGDLIFAFEKGVHRFLKFGRLPDGSAPAVLYEAVLTSNFKRCSTPILYCHSKFCELVPEELKAQINHHFDFRLPNY
jgi:hypothetical protein